MEPSDLIELLELSAGQTDHLMTRLIAELKERGAIMEDLAALQLRQVASQQASACVIVEAAMTAGTLNSTSQLLGRMYGGSIQ